MLKVTQASPFEPPRSFQRVNSIIYSWNHWELGPSLRLTVLEVPGRSEFGRPPWNTFNPILSLIHLSLSLSVSLLRYYCLFYPCHEGVRFRPGSFRPGVFYVIFSVGWLGVFTCFLVRGTSRSFLWDMCGVEKEGVLVWCGMSWCGVVGWLV